jgi:hypothetical protein
MSETLKIANELLELMRKDPTSPHVGAYARAAAEILAGMEHADAERQRTDRLATLAAEAKVELVRLCEESHKRAAELEAHLRGHKPPEPPAALTPEQRQQNAQRQVEAGISVRVAESLIAHASRLQEFVETGVEAGTYAATVDDHGKEVHAGRLEQARATVEKYRARAIELLASVDPSMLGRAGTMIGAGL